MQNKIAQFISIIFHPIIIPVLIFIIIFSLPIYPFEFYSFEAKRIFFFIVLTNTFLLPLLIIFLFLKSKLISSVGMPNNTERIVPVLLMALMTYVTFYISNAWDLPMIWKISMLLYSVMLVIVVFINFYFKISLHAIGWSSLVALSVFYSYYLQVNLFCIIISSILITGVVGYARAYLKSHKNIEILAGLSYGFLFTVGFLMVFI